MEFVFSFFQLIAECEQVKTERDTELINEQVLIAMCEMGLDRERTLQVGNKYEADPHKSIKTTCCVKDGCNGTRKPQ